MSPNVKTALDQIGDSIKDLKSIFKGGLDDIRGDIKNAIESIGTDIRDTSQQRLDNSQSDIKSVVTSVISGLQVTRFVSSIDNLTQSMISASNSMQMLGVGGYSDVERYREFVTDTAKQLNQETNGSYNLKTMYSDIASLAQSTNIARVETLKQITRPAMLAYRSMNVSLESIADYSSKLTEYAGYDSLKLENLLDNVKTVSKGMNVNEQDIINNQNEILNSILASGYSKGIQYDTDELLKSLAEATTLLEDNGINSKNFTSLVKGAIDGDQSSITELQRLGIDGYGIDLSDPDVMRKLSEQYVEGLSRIKEMSPDLTESFANSIGVDMQDVNSAFVAMSSGKYGMSIKQLDDNLNNVNTMVESVADQELSMQDMLSNKLSTMTELLTDIRETVGFGFGEVISVIATAYSIRSVLGRFGGASSGSMGSLLGSFSGGGRATAGLLGALEMGGFNASAGALTGAGAIGASLGIGALGLGGAAYGISSGIGDIKNGRTGLGLTEIAGGTAMGAGAATLLTVGASNAWNPVGWASLIAGGVTLLGTAIYKSATDLSGNAEAVTNEINSIGENLQKENDNRLNKISDLSYEFNKEQDVLEQRRLLEESGLFSQEKLQNTADENLKDLIDSYKNAASTMDNVTDNLLKTADKYYSKKQGEQQENFVSDLRGITSNSERMDALSLLKPYIDDEDLLKKIDKAGKNGKISNREWKKILSKGKHNLEDVVLDSTAMQTVDGLFDWGNSYIGTESMEDVVRYFQELSFAANNKDKQSYDAILKEIEENGLSDIFNDVYGDAVGALSKKIKSYDVGTSYVDSDQLALIHEGEAIIPKKDNPAANIAELESLRRQVLANNTALQANNNLSEEIQTLVSVVKTLLTEFTQYTEDVNKRHEDDKLNNTIRQNQLTANGSVMARLFG